jgi:hypothetical protein
VLCGNACIDTQTDKNNCGACSSYCYASNGTVKCEAGVCRTTCYTGYADCDGTPTYCETYLASNAQHCGSCTTTCSADERCVSSVCTACPAGQTACSSYCVDTSTDRNNCGSCNHYCYASYSNQTTSCVEGACVSTCTSGYLDCDGVASNGCETQVANNRLQCGACGHACASDQICASGVCVGCATGFSVCGNTCVSFSSDAANCGGCGLACVSPPHGYGVCVAGGCAIACNSGYLDCDGVSLNGCEVSAKAQTSCGACGVFCGAGEICSNAFKCEPCLAATLTGALPLSVAGTTLGRPDQFVASCAYGTAPDVAYEFTAPATGKYTFDLSGVSFSAALEVRSGTCGGGSLGCIYGWSSPLALSLSLSAGQTVVVVIDGAYSSAVGAYALTVRQD